jgi:D-arginine dehydrogenase
MTVAYDFAVIGAGAAGASAAYALSRHGSVVVIEQEPQPAYHSTGRSAAVRSDAYGPRTWQILTTASTRFFASPPPGFSDHSVEKPLGALYLGTPAEEDALRSQARDLERRSVAAVLIGPEEARRLSPVVNMDGFSLALHEPGCVSLDAGAILHGFLRLARANGTEVMLGVEVRRLSRQGGAWRIESSRGPIEAATIINAAGAWVDEIATRAGLPRRGVRPLRRTAITFAPPAGSDFTRWPMTFDMAETWYFKPEGQHIMASPADLIPTEPCDAQPDEMDIAVAIDRVETATTMKVGRLTGKWAGLRTFAPDHQAVIGPDPAEPSFVWYAGQGGNGVMGAPAGGELCAALATGGAIPVELVRLGLTAEMVSPARLPAASTPRGSSGTGWPARGRSDYFKG